MAADVYVLRARARQLVGELLGAGDDLAIAVVSADAAGDAAASWEARYELALLDGQQSLDRAAESLDDALISARQWGDPVAIARTLNRLGNVAANQLDFEEARRVLEEAMRLAVQANDDALIAECGVLSMVANSLQGDFVSARRYGLAAVDRLRRLDDPVGLVHAMFSVSMTGGVHFGDLSQASAPLTVCAAKAREALQRARALGWTAGEALSRRALAGIRSAQGRAAQAVDLIRESIRLAESVDHRSHLLRGHGVMGEVLTQ